MRRQQYIVTVNESTDNSGDPSGDLSTDDDPSVMCGKCRDNIAKEFPGVVTTPCHWHRLTTRSSIRGVAPSRTVL